MSLPLRPTRLLQYGRGPQIRCGSRCLAPAILWILGAGITNDVVQSIRRVVLRFTLSSALALPSPNYSTRLCFDAWRSHSEQV